MGERKGGMALSKRLRFEIFKRDGFRCGYCGRTPPEAILEIDHIQPKSKDGSDDINNLLSSCYDCNRGKSNIPLDKIPSSLNENLEVLKERENQIKEYGKFLKKIADREADWMSRVDAIYTSYFPKWKLSDGFKERTLRRFIRRLPLQTLIEAMHNACSRFDKDISINYFCGICWRIIKEGGTVNY